MEVLFENDKIIVCIKPAGLSSQGDGKNSFLTLLKEKTGGEIYPVHRLDTVTSGVMVYAKDTKTASFLSREIQEGRFEKEYTAVVHNLFEEKSGIMENFLFKDSKKNKSYVVKSQRKGVKKALLEYEVISEYNGLSLVKIKLHTGRTHQIRVQFSYSGHSVYGDGKYGASDNINFIALFSHSLTFTEPVTKQRMCFEGECPHWDFFPISK